MNTWHAIPSRAPCTAHSAHHFPKAEPSKICINPDVRFQQVVGQIPKLHPLHTSTAEPQELHECPNGMPQGILRGEGCVPAVMWRYIVKVREDTNKSDPAHRFRPRRRTPLPR